MRDSKGIPNHCISTSQYFPGGTQTVNERYSQALHLIETLIDDKTFYDEDNQEREWKKREKERIQKIEDRKRRGEKVGNHYRKYERARGQEVQLRWNVRVLLLGIHKIIFNFTSKN
jgi:hypothetical protein